MVSGANQEQNLLEQEQDMRKADIMRQKAHKANIMAARRFLAFGEQRGSIESSDYQKSQLSSQDEQY